jgi:hypothetical protein
MEFLSKPGEDVAQTDSQGQEISIEERVAL